MVCMFDFTLTYTLRRTSKRHWTPVIKGAGAASIIDKLIEMKLQSIQTSPLFPLQVAQRKEVKSAIAEDTCVDDARMAFI